MNPSKLLDSQVDVDENFAKYDYVIYMFTGLLSHQGALDLHS